MARVIRLDLADSQSINVVEVKSSNTVPSGEGIDRVDKYVLTLTLPANTKVDNRKLRWAIADHYRMGCGCETSSCGHWFGGVQETNKKGRKITVVAKYQRDI